MHHESCPAARKKHWAMGVDAWDQCWSMQVFFPGLRIPFQAIHAWHEAREADSRFPLLYSRKVVRPCGLAIRRAIAILNECNSPSPTLSNPMIADHV